MFADIKPDTYNIDPIGIERKIADKTKTIIVVHFTGQPCEMDQINEIVQNYNLNIPVYPDLTKEQQL